MFVRRLELVDFRSYPHIVVEFEAGCSVLVGPNGVGKTNLVEALHYLSTLDSHRVAVDAPLVRAGATTAVIRGEIVHDGRSLLVELAVEPGRANRARLNGAPVRRPGRGDGGVPARSRGRPGPRDPGAGAVRRAHGRPTVRSGQRCDAGRSAPRRPHADAGRAAGEGVREPRRVVVVRAGAAAGRVRAAACRGRGTGTGTGRRVRRTGHRAAGPPRRTGRRRGPASGDLRRAAGRAAAAGRRTVRRGGRSATPCRMTRNSRDRSWPGRW